MSVYLITIHILRLKMSAFSNRQYINFKENNINVCIQ